MDAICLFKNGDPPLAKAYGPFEFSHILGLLKKHGFLRQRTKWHRLIGGEIQEVTVIPIESAECLMAQLRQR